MDAVAFGSIRLIGVTVDDIKPMDILPVILRVNEIVGEAKDVIVLKIDEDGILGAHNLAANVIGIGDFIAGVVVAIGENPLEIKVVDERNESVDLLGRLVFKGVAREHDEIGIVGLFDHRPEMGVFDGFVTRRRVGRVSEMEIGQPQNPVAGFELEGKPIFFGVVILR